MEFLKQRWLNKAWIAERLWGVNDRTTRSKLSKKIKGVGSTFNEDEVKKLEDIRIEIEKNLR
jgi:hypothetical protein